MAITLLQYPDYVGARFSRTSSDVTVDNAIRLPGVLSLDIGRKLTPGKSWGNRSNPQTRTTGKAEYSAKLKLTEEDYEALEPYLIAKGAAFRQGLFQVSWQLTCVLYEPTVGTVRWDILGSRIMDEETSPVKDGDDGVIEASLDLDVMNILKDGKGIVIERSPFGQIGV
jgi:hypothetical protein